MNDVIGWPNNVNQIISDQTSITIGEGGIVEDQTSTGYQQRALTQIVSQKKYNVIMFFNYVEKDDKGLSEYDRFERWYEFRHKRGTVPFEFPSISKFNIDSTSEATYEYARYRITSPLQISKSGLDMQISMTWTEVYSGIVNIPEVTKASMVTVSSEGRYIKIHLDSEPEVAPTLSSNLDYEFAFSTDSGDSYTKTETPNQCIIKGSVIYFKFSFIESHAYIVRVTEKSTGTVRYLEFFI